ncbi:hypothetical protein SUGI_0382490 [Cryptomeria japonica]|nr:hypothetical protein SUGI_0382490 [Cryptomeria japonica]
MNAALLYGVYGDKGGIVGAGLGSMMALMTEQDQEREQEASASCEGMMTTVTITPPPPPPPPPPSHSSYTHNHVNGLLSASTMFHGGQDSPLSGHNHHHHSKHLVGGHFQGGQLGMNHMEVDRKFTGVERRPCRPEPSLVVRGVSEFQYQQQEKEAMGTSLEVESASSTEPRASIDLMKTKIAGHPDYPRLLAAYMDCRKTGAPADVVSALEEISEERQLERHTPTMSIGEDPELDRFMEAYCEMLRRHQAELAKPYKEGMEFINKIETQLSSLNINVIRNSSPGYSYERQGCGSSEEELSCGEAEVNELDPGAQEKELKDQLLRKYNGYFSTLKKEFLKKRKKGKLPKEGRQKLLDWWHLHFKWPYPSETDKIALAESTGLDQKQINNWFINQRKRHWKASDAMQIMVMDNLNPHTASFFIHDTEG